MSTFRQPAAESANDPAKREELEKRARRRKLIISVVTVSVIVHLVGGVLAFFWVVARYFEQPKAQFEVVKRVAVEPREREHQMETEEVASLRPKPQLSDKLQSLRPTDFAMPEIPDVPVEELVKIDTEQLVSDDIQVPTDSLSGQGASGGGGFLGGSGRAGSGLLEGTFYDLKQTGNRRETGMDEERYMQVVSEFARKFDPQVLADYYSAPRKLYLSQVVIPKMSAEEGPSAFKVASRVEPQLWVAHYRGRVKAPSSGSYRFVGMGDDVLMVRFNGRLVFDGSYENWDSVSQLDRSKRYPSPPLEGWLDLYVGSPFRVKEGETYPIEVLIGESPGVDMLMVLFIEKIGENYEKTEYGAPILPLFQMTDRPIRASTRRELPTFAETTEFWQPAPDQPSFFDMPQ